MILWEKIRLTKLEITPNYFNEIQLSKLLKGENKENVYIPVFKIKYVWEKTEPIV